MGSMGTGATANINCNHQLMVNHQDICWMEKDYRRLLYRGIMGVLVNKLKFAWWQGKWNVGLYDKGVKNERGALLYLYRVLTGPVQLWFLYLSKNLLAFEGFERFSKLIPEIKGLFYVEMLSLYSLQYKKMRGDFLETYTFEISSLAQQRSRTRGIV